MNFIEKRVCLIKISKFMYEIIFNVILDLDLQSKNVTCVTYVANYQTYYNYNEYVMLHKTTYTRHKTKI